MIQFLDDEFSELNDFLDRNYFSKIFFLCDENTHSYCLPILLGKLQTQTPFEILEIESGESMKTIETAVQLWEILAEFKADRKALLINVGGGVVTDLGGFVASTYKRGISFLNIPTTLLGMCDASIGGKTGIDLLYMKNLVGTFAQPKQIFVYKKFLQTLPYQELRSGFAEMLKHGLIADQEHWENLTTFLEINPENISPHIAASMNIKLSITEKDFEERNVRKLLNFGHTFGHAIESLLLKMNQPVPHGEAVAAGIICETKLAQLENLVSEELAEDIISKICRLYPVLDMTSFSDEEILKYMMNDKKNASQNINFTLLTRIGHGIYDIHADTSNILNSVNFYRNLHFAGFIK